MQRLFGALLAMLFAIPVQAADPIKMVVPFAAGGPVDALARLLANELAPRLQTDVVVENRGGAGGLLAIDQVMRAPADGRTILISQSPIPRLPRRSCPVHRRSFATPQRSVAISCSGRDAPISMTSPAPATNANPARVAMPATVRTDCTPCSAGARPASPPIRRISACRSQPSMRSWRSRVATEGARLRCRRFIGCPEIRPKCDSASNAGQLGAIGERRAFMITGRLTQRVCSCWPRWQSDCL